MLTLLDSLTWNKSTLRLTTPLTAACRDALGPFHDQVTALRMLSADGGLALTN